MKGELEKRFGHFFDFLHFEEKDAGPTESGRVTVKLLARKLSKKS